MFILKDIFKIGSSSRSNNTSLTENLQLRKQAKTNSVLDKGEFVLKESKNKKVHGWLSRDSKDKNRNFNDNSAKNNNDNDNKKSQHQDLKNKQYEDFRHIKRDYFKEGPINLRNVEEFEDLEGLYYNREQNICFVKNKVDERINTRKFYTHDNEETSETSKQYSSIDEEEITPTPESVEFETEMDSDKSFSDLSNDDDDYSSTAVVVYPRKNSESKNNPNKIIHKKNTAQNFSDKKLRFELSGYKRKYDSYYAEEENNRYCVCPPKCVRSNKIKHKQKYSDSNHRQHKQSTVRTSSTDPFRNSRGNPKISSNRRVVVIKQPSFHTRPKRYVENDYSKQKQTEYLFIPSGKRKFQRSRFTKSGSRTGKYYQTSSSSSDDVSSENDVYVHKYSNRTKLESNLLKRGRSKNDFVAEKTKQNQNKKIVENEKQRNREEVNCNLLLKRPQNMNDMVHKIQNYHGNSKGEEQRQGTIKESNKLLPKEGNILPASSPRKVDIIEPSNKKYENKTPLENVNKTQSSRLEKKSTKKKRHDRDFNKKCLKCKQDIFVEKGIGEPSTNRKITDPTEEKKIMQTIIDINKDVPLIEETAKFLKIKNTGKKATTTKELHRGEVQQKPVQPLSSPTTTTKNKKKNEDGNNHKSDKDNLISKINQLKKPIIDTMRSSAELQNKNSPEQNEKLRSRINDVIKRTNNETQKTKKSKQHSRCDTPLENMTSDFTTTEKSSMKKSERHNSSETRQNELLTYSNNITATYVLLDTKENIKNKPSNKTTNRKQDKSSWELLETQRDRNLQLFKLLEEMLGRRKARRSKPKNIHTVSAVSLAVTKKERTIYKELHKNILKHYRASTSTSGVTFSKTRQPIIGKNPNGTKKNNKKRKKMIKSKLEISILPGIEISPSTMRVIQHEIENNNCCLKMDNTEDQNIKTENEQNDSGREPKIFRTTRKNDNDDFSVEIKELHTGSSTIHFPPKPQSCTDTHVNVELKPSSRSIGDISRAKKLSSNSSLLVLNLSDSKDDIESREWISNKLKLSKSSGESIMKTGQQLNDYRTFQKKMFSEMPVTNKNPLVYPSTIKIEVKDIFQPGAAVQSDITESKAAAPTTPSGDTLLLTFTDSEIWGNNIKEEKILTEKEHQEERSDSNEMIEKLENSLQKSIVQDLKNCTRLSEKSISSSPDSTLNTSETQRCIEEWENLVKRKVLQQLRRKVSTYCKNEKNITDSPSLNQYSIRQENYVDNDKIQDKKEIAEADFEVNQNILSDIINKKSEKSKKRSNLSMSPLETVFEAEEHPTEVIEVELLKESNSFTQMRIFKNVENELGECEPILKDFEDKISKLQNLNDLEDMEEEMNNFLGNCSLNLQINIEGNEISLDNVKNKPSNEGDNISEKLMNIYSFNILKNNNNQAQDNTTTVKSLTTVQSECSDASSITTPKLPVESKPQEEKEGDERGKLEKSECQSNSFIPEDTVKSSETSTKTKGNKKLFSRLPVYVKKVKDLRGSLFSHPQQIEKSAEPSKAIPVYPIQKEGENKKQNKSTQDEGTTCNLIQTKKVDNMINTEVQEKKDQTTNYDTKIKNKQNKSVSCDFQENIKPYHGLLANRNKVKDVISNCIQKCRTIHFNKESDDNKDTNKTGQQKHKASICSDSSQFTTSTESLYIGDNSDLDTTYHSRTEKECQTTCIQNFTTDATYADKRQKHNSYPDNSQSQRSSTEYTDFSYSSKTIESDLLDLSTHTTTYSTFNEEHDDILQCESEDTPNRLISVLDEKIKKLSKQTDIIKCNNSTCVGFMKIPKLPDDDLSSNGQCISKKQNRSTKKNERTPKYYHVTSRTRSSFTKVKPRVTYNLTKESSAFCNLQQNLNIRKKASEKSRPRNKIDNKSQMDSKNLSSFHKRKLYWESLRKQEKKCTFAINTKKSKYFLMLSGKDKKKGSDRKKDTSFFEKILKPSEPSIFFKTFSNRQNRYTKEVENKDYKTKLKRPLSPKINTIKMVHNKNYPPQYKNPFIECNRCVRVRHSSSLISVTNKSETDEQKRPSSENSERDILKERLPTFYSYNFSNEDTNNNKKNNYYSSDSIINNNEKMINFPLVTNFKITERKSLPLMDRVATSTDIKNQANFHSDDLDFVQNYDISELCNGNMDYTLEKQFVYKVRKRAEELFKNFMEELSADSFTVNKKEKGRTCGYENTRQETESFAGEIYDNNDDLSTEKSFSHKMRLSQSGESNPETVEGNCFNNKSKASSFSDYMEDNGKKYKEEVYDIGSANTSGDTNITSFGEYEDAYTTESSYQLNKKINKFSHKPVTLARAEIAPYPNYINKDFTQRFNNDGDIIKENQTHANLNVDNKIFFNRKNHSSGQALECNKEKKFDVESFDGDLYNSGSEINFTPSADANSKLSSKSPSSIKILSTIDSISCADEKHMPPTRAYENKEHAICNLQTVTGELFRETVDNPQILENKADHFDPSKSSVTSDSHPFIHVRSSVSQSSHLKICKSIDSFNGEAFRPSESSYFSSDTETVKQDTDTKGKYSGNCSESFDECNENCSETDFTTSSISQTNGPYLIIHDCVISDEDKFLQDFTETSSFATDNLSTNKQEESDSKSDFSTTFFNHTVPYHYVSVDEEIYTSGREAIEMDNNNVTKNTEAQDGKDSLSVENQNYYPNYKFGSTTNAQKIYESPVDPFLSSIRVYHEKIITDAKEKLFQGECSTFYTNENKESSTTTLNINNCIDATALDEFVMTLTSYESSPNLCSTQNRNQGFGIITNSGTSKLTPEEMDSGFESTKQKTNTQRLLMKTVSTSDLQDLNTSFNSIQESRSSHSMFASVSSCSVTKNFFHNVRRKTSRKKKESLTALSRAVQLQRRSSIHLNQSFHWKQFWKNVQQMKDDPTKQTIDDDISKGDVGQFKEALTEDKHLLLDSLKHLKDFHFENTYLSYNLFELDNDPMNKTYNGKLFPVGNRNFLTYNVYVYNGKELRDKATQTKDGVYYIPYVSVIAIPAASSSFSKLNLPQQQTEESNSQLFDSSSRHENKKPAHPYLKMVSERNETFYSDLDEIRHERRPHRKKKTKKTEDNANLYDTISIDDSGCGTFSSEKSYKIPKKLNMETFQGHETVTHEDYLACIEECRSSLQYLITTNSSCTDNPNTEEEHLSTSENEGASTSWKIRDSKCSVNEPSSSSTIVNRHSTVGKRKLRKRSNKNPERNNFNIRDCLYSSDTNEESLKSNYDEDQNVCCRKQGNNIRMPRPVLTFVKNKERLSKPKQHNDDNLKSVQDKIRHALGNSTIPQPNINIVASDTEQQQLSTVLNQKHPTITFENEAQPCSCMKKLMEIGNPQSSAEIKKIQEFYEVVGCSCSSKQVTDEVVEGQIEIEEELDHGTESVNDETEIDETDELLHQEERESEVINEVVFQKDVQPCTCMKKIMEIFNPQTPDEIKKVHKFYETVGCSCVSKEVTDKVEISDKVKITDKVEATNKVEHTDNAEVADKVKVTDKVEATNKVEHTDNAEVTDKVDFTEKVVTDQLKADSELDNYIHTVDVEAAVGEISEARLHRQVDSEAIDEEHPKLVKRTAIPEIIDKEQTTMLINYEKSLNDKDKKKGSPHCLMSETELLKQQNNKEQEVRSSLTDKEIFEKLLATYEKEDKLIRELSHGHDLIEIQSTAEEKQQSTINFDESEHNHSDTEGNKSKIVEEVKNEKHKKEQSIQRKKMVTSSSIEIEQRESGSLKTVDSEVNTQPRRTRFFGKNKIELKKPLLTKKRSSFYLSDQGTDKEKETVKSKKTKVSDGISFTSNEDSLKSKKGGEVKSIAEEDIIKSKELGRCFRRGFRPDSTTLSGEPCLSLSPEEEVSRLNTLEARENSLIEFSERGSPLDYLLSLGFSIDEASNAIKDEDVKHRLYAAITEARIWVNHINPNQGTLLYLAAYKTKPSIMRYFLQIIEAIINGRINDAVKLDAFIKLLEKVEDGEISIVRILGFDQFEDEVNEEIILKKQLRQLFVTIFKIAGKEANMKGRELDKDTIELLRILAARYRAGLHPHLELIARYIGQGLLVNEIQLEAAMIYLSRLDTADVNLSQFEKYCSITCGKNTNKDK